MKVAELRAPDGRALRLHPRLAFIEADESTRASLVTALRNAMRPGGAPAGYVEVHGLLLDLDRETLRLLDLDPAPELVLAASDIPVEAFGPAGRRKRAADDVANKQRELVDARRQQVQGALDVVNAVQGALRIATAERDQAAAALASSDRQFADAIASREAAERAVDALADAVDDEPLTSIAVARAPEPLDDDVVDAELGDDEAVDDAFEVDPWADQRVERLEECRSAEQRVVAARAEVEHAARAANPARLSQQDRDELDAAHEAALDADDRASRRFGGAGARKKLDDARAAERVVLDRLGLDSYSDFLLRSSMGATDPSAELRLEIARTELMEAERALSAARAAADAVPDPPPSRPARVRTPRPKPEPVAATPVVPAPAAASAASVNGEAVARLAAATRARDDAVAAEQRAHADHRDAGVALADAEAKLVELSVRYDEAEQTLAQARVRVDAAIAHTAEANGHPSDPAWGDGDLAASAVPNEIDRHLLAWLAARGQHPLADPLPIVLDEVYRHVEGEDLDALLVRLDRLAESLHVVYMTDDPKVLHWAAALPPERAGLAVLPAAGRAAPA
jgi:hypothetical protein